MTASPARQLALDLPHRPALGREDFLVSPANEEAVAWIDRWPDWPGGVLAICGPAGAGKTHLIEVWRARSGAAYLPVADFAAGDWMDMGPALAIDSIAGDLPEQDLLHALNWARAQGITLLLAGDRPPTAWSMTLPDLKSRLHTLPAVTIGPPDDALLTAVLVKQFADRQLKVDPEVVQYILKRVERSFAAIRRTVETLDRRALAEKRALTIPFVRTVLEGGGSRD